MAKAKLPKFISPAGLAVWPHLNEPDYEYNANGTFHVKLRADSDLPAVAKLIETLDTAHEASKAAFFEELKGMKDKYKTAAAAKKALKDGDKPYVYLTDDDGEDTNEVEFNFKMSYKVPKKGAEGDFWVFTPTFIDGAGKVIKGEVPAIWGGSELKIRYVIQPWASVKLGASVRLRMDAVQIINLVTAGEGNADGFGDEGGDYVAVDEAEGFANNADSDTSAEPAADAASDDGDF